MKMKKLLFVALALCLVFTIVISCGGTPTPAQEPVQEAPPPPPPQTITFDGYSTYDVVRGDTLSSIAIKLYGTGNGYYYPLIALGSKVGRIDGIIIDNVEDIDLIEPGMKLLIPDLQRNLDNSIARGILKFYMGGEVAAYNENKGRYDDAAELRKLADSL